jgi:hypothetical protein
MALPNGPATEAAKIATITEGQRSMRPVAVVMLHEGAQYALKIRVVQDQQPVKTP